MLAAVETLPSRGVRIFANGPRGAWEIMENSNLIKALELSGYYDKVKGYFVGNNYEIRHSIIHHFPRSRDALVTISDNELTSYFTVTGQTIKRRSNNIGVVFINNNINCSLKYLIGDKDLEICGDNMLVPKTNVVCVGIDDTNDYNMEYLQKHDIKTITRQEIGETIPDVLATLPHCETIHTAFSVNALHPDSFPCTKNTRGLYLGEALQLVNQIYNDRRANSLDFTGYQPSLNIQYKDLCTDIAKDILVAGTTNATRFGLL